MLHDILVQAYIVCFTVLDFGFGMTKPEFQS